MTVGRKFREKLQLFDPGQTRRMETVLICPAGATSGLRKRGYFDRFLELEDIVQLR